MSEIVKVDPAQMDVRDRPMTAGLLKTLSKGPTVPVRYRNKPNDMLAAILVGKEMGIEPMEAINSLFLVNGQVSMTGKLMSSLVHRAGHQLRVKIGKTSSTVTCLRRDQYTNELVEVGGITFGEVEAKRAGLTDKETYQAYPTIMWTWRAISQACRIYFADVLSGISYVPEEVDIDAPTEPIPLDEDMVVDIEEADLTLENRTAEVAEILEAEVVT